MNSADTDLTNHAGSKYAVDRMGSGFVNAKKAVNAKVLVYDEEILSGFPYHSAFSNIPSMVKTIP